MAIAEPKTKPAEKQKQVKPQPLLRKAAKKINFASAAPVAKMKLPSNLKIRSAPTILRLSDSAALENFTIAGASAEKLIGADYKFLIERASPARSLEYYAARYKTEVGSIAAVNYKLPSAAWVIPVGFSDVAKLPSFMAYEVKEKSATLETLARNLRVNLTDLKYYNGIKDTAMTLTQSWLLVPQGSLPALNPDLLPADDPSRKRQLDMKIGGEQKFVIHKVGDDENLHQYASLYKTSLEAILTVTMTPPLWAGTIAVIPLGITDVANLPRFEALQTQSGGAVEALARELNVDPQKLSYYNDIERGENLRPGDWLLIPRSRSSALWRSASVRSGV